MRNKAGITLFTVVSFLGLIMIISLTLVSFVISTQNISQRVYKNAKATFIAEAGIDKAVWCLNNSAACNPGYTGETTAIDGGTFSTVLAQIGQEYEVVSTGTYDNVEKKLKVSITSTTTTAGASFFYGVQVGAGGLTMGNGAYVDGNIYSNGSIEAQNGAYVTGDVYVAGGTALTDDQEQVSYNSEYSFGNAETTEDISQSFIPSTTETINYVDLYLKKAGLPSNASVYITEDSAGEPATSAIASGTLQATLVTSSFEWVRISFASNPTLTSGETYWIVVDVGTPKSSKYYIIGKQTNAGYGNGVGLYSSNWSSGDWSSANGDFTFKTWMGGIDTHINNLIVGDTGHTCDDTHYDTHHGDAHANQIVNSTVECDAHYDSDPDDISGTTVGRNKIADSTDPPPETLPVSNGRILDWKNEAAEGTLIEGNYELLLGESQSLGPAKITGNMNISNGSELTLTGNIWVEGTITFSNNALINLDSGYGANSGIIVSDGNIAVSNNVIFNGSGEDGSYVLVLTTSTSLDTGSPAIDINNNAETVIFYAGQGLIKVANNALLREATGYALDLANNASVSYESGLANANFANGPGGIWTTDKKTWQEIN